jgi:hypothetical protein
MVSGQKSQKMETPIYPLTITVQLNYLTYLVPCSRGAPESEIYAALLIIPTYTVIHKMLLYLQYFVKFGLCQQHSTQLNNRTPNKFRDCWCQLYKQLSPPQPWRYRTDVQVLPCCAGVPSPPNNPPSTKPNRKLEHVG